MSVLAGSGPESGCRLRGPERGRAIAALALASVVPSEQLPSTGGTRGSSDQLAPSPPPPSAPGPAHLTYQTTTSCGQAEPCSLLATAQHQGSVGFCKSGVSVVEWTEIQLSSPLDLGSNVNFEI